MNVLSPHQGRVARPASPQYNLLKTALDCAGMRLLFLGVLPAALYGLEKRLLYRHNRGSGPDWRVAGGVLFGLGEVLTEVSAAALAVQGQGTPWPLDCPRELVMTGPYRYVRNPMALGSFAQGVAIGLILRSPLVTAYALSGAVGWQILVRPWEERDLARRFGAKYTDYQHQVRCWLPQCRPYRAAPGARTERNPNSEH